MVRTSMSRGTLPSLSGRSVSSAAHMIGSAAFLAPETVTWPSSGRPPVILSLSIGFLPFVRRECLHGECVDLLAHALAERGVDELVALHPAAPGELARNDERLEVLAVADHFQMLAGNPARYAFLHAFCSDHLNASACSPTSGAPDRRKIRQSGSPRPPPCSAPARHRIGRRNRSGSRRSGRRRGWRARA